MTTIQDRIIEKARKELGVKKIIFTVDGKTEESWFLDRETEQFLIQSIKLVEKETRKEIIKELKKHDDTCLRCGMSYENHKKIETSLTTWNTDIPCGGTNSFIGINLVLELLSITNKEKQNK